MAAKKISPAPLPVATMQISLKLEPALVERIDHAAKALGLSRAAWLRMQSIKALNNGGE